jgi:hypothetical protein
MNAALWTDLLADVGAAEQHFLAAQRILDHGELLNESFAGYDARMAFMHAMQSGHTSVETGLRRLLSVLGEPMPSGGDWHADLISRLGRPIDGGRSAVFSEDLTLALQETRRFRHVAMHSYDTFKLPLAVLAAQAGQKVARELRPALERFRVALG